MCNNVVKQVVLETSRRLNRVYRLKIDFVNNMGVTVIAYCTLAPCCEQAVQRHADCTGG
jgi:hypothetical protein